MEDRRHAAYLARLGLPAAPAPAAEALPILQEAHLRRIPFETLGIHLDEPMELEVGWLVDKLALRHRGGFCYELNGAFAALLEALGYEVERHSARVFRDDGAPGPPFDHLALVVRPATGPRSAWLVDVGFGESFVHPLPFAAGAEGEDRAGRFRLAAGPDGAVDLLHDDRPAYRIEPGDHHLEDFRPTWWYHRTSPDSHFTRVPVCSLLTGDGRATLAGRRLVVTAKGARTERVVADDRELLVIYRDTFGIALDRVPRSE